MPDSTHLLQKTKLKFPNMPNWLQKFLFPLLILIAWVLLTTFGDIPDLVLPPLESIFMDFFSLIRSGELPLHIFFSLQRSLYGFFIGACCGILLGIIMGWSNFWSNFLDLTINFLRSIPKTALAPLFIIWFGLGDLPKVLLIGLSSFFFTVIPTIEGVKNVDHIVIKSARSLGANQWQIMKSVILPAALPAIFAGIRLAITTSLIVLVMVEIIAGSNGLGYLLQEARENLDVAVMFATLLTLGILGYALDAGVRFIARVVMPWRRGKTLSY